MSEQSLKRETRISPVTGKPEYKYEGDTIWVEEQEEDNE